MSTQQPIQIKAVQKASFTGVSSRLLQRKCACGGTRGVDGECEECRSQRLSMQRQASITSTPTAPPIVPPIVHEVLGSPGQQLDTGTRSFMEPRFGHDFSNVAVHTDQKAGESARAVKALAYTVGRDVVFGEGRYAPRTTEGKRLIAHELTHVVQQHAGPTGIQDRVSDDVAGKQYEAEANRVAGLITHGRGVKNEFMRTSPTIQRAPDDESERQQMKSPGPGEPLPYREATALNECMQALDDLKECERLTGINLEFPTTQPTPEGPDIVTMLVEAAKPLLKQTIVGGPAKDKNETFSTILQVIEKQIGAPEKQPPKEREYLRPLYGEKIVAELNKLKLQTKRQSRKGKKSSTARSEIYTKVHDELLESFSEMAGIDFKQEYAELTKEEERKELKAKREEFESQKKSLSPGERKQKRAELAEEQKKLAIAPSISGGLDSYISFIRPALIALLGDFPSIKHFFETKITSINFLNREKLKVVVHVEMAAKLKKAQDLLMQRPQWQVIADTIGTIWGLGGDPSSLGGLEVRPNTTRPDEISKHALGLSIDINATANPHFMKHPHMFATFPSELVEVLSGQKVRADLESVYMSEEAQTHKDPGTPSNIQNLTRTIQRVLEASRTFKREARSVFQDKDKLQTRLQEYLAEHKDADAAVHVNTLIKMFEERAKAVKAVSNKKLSDKDKKKAEKDLKAIEDSISLSIANIKDSLLKNKAQSSEQAKDVESVLLQASDVFAYTRDEQGKFTALEAKIESTPAIAASQGFFNLRPELVAALIGAGLSWLGASPRTKDFMHFEVPGSVMELTKGDRPSP